MRKPNYRYERAERERLQAERQARRDERRRGRGPAEGGSEPPAREATDPIANLDPGLPERRDD